MMDPRGRELLLAVLERVCGDDETDKAVDALKAYWATSVAAAPVERCRHGHPQPCPPRRGEGRRLRHCWQIERRAGTCTFAGCGHRAAYYCTLPGKWLACEAHALEMGVFANPAEPPCAFCDHAKDRHAFNDEGNEGHAWCMELDCRCVEYLTHPDKCAKCADEPTEAPLRDCIYAGVRCRATDHRNCPAPAEPAQPAPQGTVGGGARLPWKELAKRLLSQWKWTRGDRDWWRDRWNEAMETVATRDDYIARLEAKLVPIPAPPPAEAADSHESIATRYALANMDFGKPDARRKYNVHTCFDGPAKPGFCVDCDEDMSTDRGEETGQGYRSHQRKPPVEAAPPGPKWAVGQVRLIKRPGADAFSAPLTLWLDLPGGQWIARDAKTVPFAVNETWESHLLSTPSPESTGGGR